MRRLLLLLCAVGCGSDPLANEGFSIDCGDAACDWEVIEGEAVFGPSWHDADPGLDLSAPGRIVVEQRAAPLLFTERELVLGAAVARDPSVTLRFEIDWYVGGSGAGATYWEREPRLVATRGFTVGESGVFALEKRISTPTPEVNGLVLRIVKEGRGRAVVDEVTIRERLEEVAR